MGEEYEAVAKDGKKKGSNIEVVNQWKEKGVEEVFTTFVDNLPKSMAKEWLWQIFQIRGSSHGCFLIIQQKGRKMNNSLDLFDLHKRRRH